MKKYAKMMNYAVVVINVSVLLFQIFWKCLPIVRAIVSNEALAIGVIGGADGPTTIFLAGAWPFYDILFLLLLVINVVAGIVNIRR
jgi:Na+-transporting methylmalonyl-CoA/oxaloacetate decarboxylase beta subunit